jgi:hypothetical protein
VAKPFTDLKISELEELAYQYIDECVANKKEWPTNAGKVVKVQDRHIPTIEYFLLYWIPKQGKPKISRSTYYNWLNIERTIPKDKQTEEHRTKFDTIKKIDELFKAVATDIVANEGKGIFYAKNRLNMTDKLQQQITEQPLFPEEDK